MGILEHLIPKAALNPMNPVCIEVATDEMPKRRGTDPRTIWLGKDCQAA
jgi:hypothetical protein